MIWLVRVVDVEAFFKIRQKGDFYNGEVPHIGKLTYLVAL